MIVPNALRHLRLRMLMARDLLNWREAWAGYMHAAAMPPLRFRNGLVLHHGPGDSAGFLFFEVFANGCYRHGLPRTLAGDVIDVGANIGAFTLDAATRYAPSTVHAYEPDPRTFAVLRHNVEANGLSSRVRVWNEAVAGAPGTLTLWRGEGSIAASTHAAAHHASECCEVPAVTLQTVVERAATRIALLKMDAEGAEADILEGAGTALGAVDRIVAEYHDWLVPDVLPRVERVLRPRFDVRAGHGRRRGSMFTARRRQDGI
ncbi:MAG TPA: FkbM family methyltransferase [Vicinamibacterales bacterium]|nr:FkbM family methyltransferase [Vicinamibacterales bacterium]